MKTVAIIQARLSSTRLPSKVLLKLAGKTVLEHMVEKARRIRGVDSVVLAIPEHEFSDRQLPDADLIVRGSLKDVLARYQKAATESKADIIVRLTADCPLLDPEVSSGVVELQRMTRCHYACNVKPRTWPKGLDTEVFTRVVLEQAHERAFKVYDREHVTPWIQEWFRVENLSSHDPMMADHNWCLDTPSDYDYLRYICEKGMPKNYRETLDRC